MEKGEAAEELMPNSIGELIDKHSDGKEYTVILEAIAVQLEKEGYSGYVPDFFRKLGERYMELHKMYEEAKDWKSPERQELFKWLGSRKEQGDTEEHTFENPYGQS